MNKIPYFFALILIMAAATARAQKPATIFEALAIKNGTCPIDEQSASVPQVETVMSPRDFDDNNEELNNAEKIRAAQPAIAAFMQNITRKTLPIKVMDFYPSGNYLMQKGDEYSLYNKAGKLLFRDHFIYIQKRPFETGGFNGYKKSGLSKFYDGDGKLLFDEKFEYVSTYNKKYFRFKKGNKQGIINRQGKILLDAEYLQAEAFDFNGQTWFCVWDNGVCKYLEPDGKTKVWIYNYDVERPEIIKNRYWEVAGRIYDMKEKKRLFCSIDYIRVINAEQGILSTNIDKGRTRITYRFDVSGKLVNKTYAETVAKIDNETNIAYAPGGADSSVGSYGENIRRYGISTKTGSWMIPPVFSLLQNADSGYLFFAKGSFKNGLMNKAGKVLIPEGKYTAITAVGKEQFLCANTDSSFIFNAGNGSTRLLKDHIISLSKSGKDGKVILASLADGNTAFASSDNFSLLPYPSFRSVFYSDYYETFYCTLSKSGRNNTSTDYRLFYNKDLEPLVFTIGGKIVDTLADLNKTDNGLFNIELPDGTSYLQTAKETFLPHHYKTVRFDTANNWYTAYSEKDRGYGAFDKTGKVIIPFCCNSIGNFDPESQTTAFTLGSNDEQKITSTGEILFDMAYEKVRPVKFNKFEVTKNRKVGIVDRSNNILVPIRYKYINMEGETITATLPDGDTVNYDLKILYP